MATKILVMGLPGAGKTYFAEKLKQYLEENAPPIHSMINNDNGYSEYCSQIY